MVSAVTKPIASGYRRRILLIEDNVADSILASYSHEDVKLCSWLEIIADSDKALERIRTAFADRDSADRPDIVVMDLNMPKRNGIELLRIIRSLGGCDVLPVVILTGSDSPKEIREAYAAGANCVIKKPGNLNEYLRVLESCYQFWCTVASLPHAS